MLKIAEFGLQRAETVEIDIALGFYNTSHCARRRGFDGDQRGRKRRSFGGTNGVTCHLHLILSRTGDTKKLGGGVRGVIPARQSY